MELSEEREVSFIACMRQTGRGAAEVDADSLPSRICATSRTLMLGAKKGMNSVAEMPPFRISNDELH